MIYNQLAALDESMVFPQLLSERLAYPPMIGRSNQAKRHDPERPHRVVCCLLGIEPPASAYRSGAAATLVNLLPLNSTKSGIRRCG